MTQRDWCCLTNHGNSQPQIHLMTRLQTAGIFQETASPGDAVGAFCLGFPPSVRKGSRRNPAKGEGCQTWKVGVQFAQRESPRSHQGLASKVP